MITFVVHNRSDKKPAVSGHFSFHHILPLRFSHDIFWNDGENTGVKVFSLHKCIGNT